MWREVLGLALLTSLNPVLLAFVLLVISRPRPVPNMLVFWVGCLIVNVPGFLVPLMVLHLVPTFESVARDIATQDPGSNVKPFQLVTGVLALLVAAAMTARVWIRQRRTQPAPSGAGGNGSILVLDSHTPTTSSRSSGRVRDAVTNIGSTIRRLTSRAHDSWENGALWVSLVFGLMYLPPPPLVLLVDTALVGSGAPIGTQVLAVIAFVIVMLAVFEIALLSYIVAPAKTLAILQPVHDWSRDHRQHVLLVLFALVGAWQVATGTGLV